MILLYESDDQSDARNIEKALIEYCYGTDKNINRRRGGGGRHSAGPTYQVYLALRLSIPIQ